MNVKLWVVMLMCSAVFSQELIDSGYANPMMTLPVDNHLLVAEREGKIFNDGNLLFFQEVDTFGEGGLLSMLYDNGTLLIYYSGETHNLVDAYTVDLDANTAVFSHHVIEQENGFERIASNHQGGTLMKINNWFYLTLGDSNQKWLAQLDSVLYGKILRFDINGNGHPDNTLYDPDSPRTAESRTFAKGFRNPFRCFAWAGQMYVADVGDAQREEFTVVNQDDNGGWPFFEGEIEFTGVVPDNPDTGLPYQLTNYKPPLFSYTHDDSGFYTPDFIEYDFNGVSIIGGAKVGNDFIFMDYFRSPVLLFKGDSVEQIGTLSTRIVHIIRVGDFVYFTDNDGDIYRMNISTLSLDEFNINNYTGKSYILYNVLGQELMQGVFNRYTIGLMPKNELVYMRFENGYVKDFIKQ